MTTLSSEQLLSSSPRHTTTSTSDRCDWDAIIKRAQSHPHEVKSFRTGNGENALFVAIQLYAPKHVIELFLKISPRSAKEMNKLTRLTALHLAVSRGCHPDVIKLIVQAWPKAVIVPSSLSGGSLPLHSVKNVETAVTLVEANKSCLWATNKAGYLPIHRIAYATNVPPNVLDYLIKEGKKHNVGGRNGGGGILIKTENGITPLRAAIDMIDKGSEKMEFLSNDTETRLSHAANNKWKKLVAVVVSHNELREKETIRRNKHLMKQCEGRKTPLLHAVVAAHCPRSIVSYALKLNPKACSELDRFGNSVLHLAVSSVHVRENLVKLLVDDPYGEQMQAKMIDRLGRLPLHNYICLAHGRYDNVMKLLVDCEPRALEARDGTKGMYSFMLAAERENSDVDTIYSLLREAPWLVSRCLDVGLLQKDKEKSLRNIHRQSSSLRYLFNEIQGIAANRFGTVLLSLFFYFFIPMVLSILAFQVLKESS